MKLSLNHAWKDNANNGGVIPFPLNIDMAGMSKIKYSRSRTDNNNGDQRRSLK
jgi:hypothetical protein